MEQHTKEKLKITWGDDKVIESRAKRGKGTSAPTPEEIKISEIFLKKAFLGKKKTRTLVLGATPELRDLVIRHNSETVAVDISPKLLFALTNVMQCRDNPNNKYMVGDWLEMHKFLPKKSFDAVLGDGSLNNIPFNTYDKMFRILSYLLKDTGYIIIRHYVCPDPLTKKTPQEIVDNYNKGNNTLFGLILELGFYTDIRKKAYNHKTKELDWSYVYGYYDFVKNQLKEEEIPFFDNMMMHTKSNKTVKPFLPEFKSKVKKYFSIEKVGFAKAIGHSYMAPIYCLKPKKKKISDLLLDIEKME